MQSTIKDDGLSSDDMSVLQYILENVKGASPTSAPVAVQFDEAPSE
ncbi:MAG TPA: hypothetical protein PKD19_01310 [Candidatus Saccharibacteria bacterium]|jgi:hypothetical protein|nr:hypothetical protein [Candidatus Saccharibacteria bacterium]HMR37964.1 hypothetical protein [Candidatus Saccharibacteria bacterium]